MSSSLEQLIPRFDAAFDALESDDLDTFVGICRDIAHPSVEFNSAIGSAVGGQSYTGIEGLRTWFGDLLDTAEQVRYLDRRYETSADRVILMLARFELTGAAGGVPVSSEVGSVFEFDGGACVRITSFTSKAEAREFMEVQLADA